MSAADDTRVKLKRLRDQLAFEAPHARTRQSAPPELFQQLQAALDLVNRAYRLDSASGASVKLEELYDDAIVEGHLILHEWERWLELDKEQKLKSGTPATDDRRQHEPEETNIAVRLLRHTLRDDGAGGITVHSETSSRPARNVSLGGIFVAVPTTELTQVGDGNVLHVSVTTSLGASLSFHARAVVTRRDATGLVLRWVHDSDGVGQAVGSLLEAISRSRVRP